MADLLGSILGSMETPPTLGDSERKKAREQKKRQEKLQQQEKEKLNAFRKKVQNCIDAFLKDSTSEKHKFSPMDKVYRAIVHEVADVAGLTSFSFGQDEIDRYIMVWKKEFAPSDEELAACRKGEPWDPLKAKEQLKRKEDALLEAETISIHVKEEATPGNYKEKYEHLLGKASAKDAAQITTANKAYGFVTSENKKDRRTIEQVMADNQARKKLKTDNSGQEQNYTASQPVDL